MKGKIPKVLGVGLALALVLSFSLVAAAPAVALTQPTVSIDDYTISTVDAGYTIVFTPSHELLGDTVSTESSTSDTITITFPSDTLVASSPTGTIGATSGWFSADYTGTSGWQDAANLGSAGTWSGSPTARTVTYTLDTSGAIGAGAQVWINLSAGITNPSAVGDYTLTVKTSEETTAVTSASYSITAPVLGGTVEVYNPSDVLMKTYSGDAAVASAVTAYGGSDNYTIEVGPGTYTLNTGNYGVSIYAEGLTLRSTGTAADTILDASTCISAGIWIDEGADDVTVDGFTIDGSLGDGIGICHNTEGVTIQNNIISDAGNSGIALAYDIAESTEVVTGATVSGNVLTDCNTGIDFGGCTKNITISGNTITGCAATGRGISFNGGSSTYPTKGTTISGNTITDNACMGIYVKETGSVGDYFENNVIKGNTISGNTMEGIKIAADLAKLTDLVITDNDITDNTEVGIEVGTWDADLTTASAIKFNNITGNDTTSGYGLTNTTSEVTVVVDATHNWWGTSVSSEIAAMVNDTSTGVTDYTPFLTDTVDAVFSATAVDTAVLSLDAETDVGVEVLGTGYTPYVVSAAKYIANPGAPLDNALAFYDVYVTGAVGTVLTDTVMLHFYAGDDDAVLYAWSSNTATWVAVSPAAVFSEFGGYLHVTLNTTGAATPSTPNIADLTGTPFAVCGAAAVDILAYYRGYSGDAEVVETTDLLKAANDWANAVVPPDFTEPISTTQLLVLANEWAATG